MGPVLFVQERCKRPSHCPSCPPEGAESESIASLLLDATLSLSLSAHTLTLCSRSCSHWHPSRLSQPASRTRAASRSPRPPLPTLHLSTRSSPTRNRRDDRRRGACACPAGFTRRTRISRCALSPRSHWRGSPAGCLLIGGRGHRRGADEARCRSEHFLTPTTQLLRIPLARPLLPFPLLLLLLAPRPSSKTPHGSPPLHSPHHRHLLPEAIRLRQPAPPARPRTLAPEGHPLPLSGHRRTIRALQTPSFEVEVPAASSLVRQRRDRGPWTGGDGSCPL